MPTSRWHSTTTTLDQTGVLAIAHILTFPAFSPEYYGAKDGLLLTDDFWYSACVLRLRAKHHGALDWAGVSEPKYDKYGNFGPIWRVPELFPTSLQPTLI